MKRTKREVTVTMNCGAAPYTVKIPKGQRVAPDGQGGYFVEDFHTFIDPKKEPITYHDATHYGLRVMEEDVVDDPTTR